MTVLVVAVATLPAALALALWAVLSSPRHVPAESGPAVPAASGAAGTSGLQQRMAVLASRLSRAGYPARLQHRLDLAGNPGSWDAARVLSLKGVGLIGGALLGLLFGAKHGPSVTVMLVGFVAFIGFGLPDVWIRNLGEKRQQLVQRGLPDAMDMMTVCVEAGLGFDAALGRVARTLDGPIAQECARVLQEMQFGMSRSEALRSLLNRTDVVELRAFVAAIVQSSELGISIGDVLREQAKQLRTGRRQRAEEKAQQLQVKLLFPLITCLLPAMFIVILGPAVLQIVGFFGKAPH